MSTVTAALSLIRTTFNQLDLKLPAALDKEIAATGEIRARARAGALADPAADLGSAIAAALAAGKHPADDEKVRHTLAVRELAPIGEKALDTHLDGRIETAFAAHSDAIVTAMTPVVEAADKTLERVRGIVPDLDLRDAGRLGSLAPKQLAAWGEARDAIGRVERVAKAWGVLASALRRPVAPNRRPLLLADLTAAELRALGHQPNAVDAAHAGHRIALATFAEYDDRVTRLADAINDEAQAAGDRTQKAWARRLSIKVPTP